MGKTFVRYDVVEGTSKEQTQLEAAWVTPTFIAAAEILQYYKIDGATASGWPSDEIQQFEAFIIKIRNAQINPLIKAVDSGKRQNNWGVSAGYAKMAIGIYLDNVTDYEDGKRIIMKLLPIIIKEDGEVFELCSRDCHHPQYSMTGLSYAAEIAKIQGDDSIYEFGSRRILIGWEWIYTTYLDEVSCRSCAGKAVFPGIEVAADYYDTSSDMASLAALKRPNSVTSSHTFLGFTSLTHHKDK